MADFLQDSAKNAVQSLYPNAEIILNLTFDPPWDSNMITEKGKMELGLL
jgi:metal-sulfur cluster biosynthetic enzyme